MFGDLGNYTMRLTVYDPPRTSAFDVFVIEVKGTCVRVDGAHLGSQEAWLLSALLCCRDWPAPSCSMCWVLSTDNIRPVSNVALFAMDRTRAEGPWRVQVNFSEVVYSFNPQACPQPARLARGRPCARVRTVLPPWCFPCVAATCAGTEQGTSFHLLPAV